MLSKRGIISPEATRVIIEARTDDMLRIYEERYAGIEFLNIEFPTGTIGSVVLDNKGRYTKERKEIG